MHDEQSKALQDLHERYIFDVNAALAEGRNDLVAKLVADYPDAALEVMAG